MRDNLVVAGMVLAILLSTVGIVAVVNAPTHGERVVDVSPGALDGDPAFYEGVTVRLPTSGMQPGPTNKTLVYRKRADAEPVVVLEFDAPVPDPVPVKVVGKVVGRKGPSVVVSGCHPDTSR